MRIVFMGSTEFSLEALEALDKLDDVDIVAVYTRAPKPKGRGHKEQVTPTHRYADEHDIPVRTPKTLRDEAEQDILKTYTPDLIVVAAYGLILPQAVLDIPKRGCINIHASLLPRWRGAAPIQHTLLSDDTETGITIMQMDAGMDTGAILMLEGFPIAEDDNVHTLHAKLASLGALMIVEALKNIDKLTPMPQDDAQATLAPKVTKDMTWLDSHLSMHANWCKVRAFCPARLNYGDGDNFLLVHAANHTAQLHSDPTPILGDILAQDATSLYMRCKDGYLTLTRIQKPGKRVLEAPEFLRGLH